MGVNKKQFLIIALLCAHDGLAVCTCFKNSQPTPKVKKEPAQQPGLSDQRSTQTTSAPIATTSGQSVPSSYVRISDAFNWPPPSGSTEADLKAEDDFIATATRAHLAANPQANRRMTVLDGSKWALCTVAVMLVGAWIYRVFTFPERMVNELRNQLRAAQNQKNN